ncbi:uncharacterized membrane protein [[Candida] railenensis]|uniref:Uncharacterized membrane protein n=1 Tax=[Candida] railenensis TaxID=45579 RepID=A0A9P0VZA7_9ASCO|nr:uncharacterized membrane protein [[Candida] railenensis]
MHLLFSFRESSKDVRLLWISVFLRMASFGLTNQVLTLFLKSLDVSETNIGLFMTLTLVGDTIISYLLTWHADKIGRRLVMIIGALMMFVSGAVFSVSSHFVVLLIAAILGVISPSGDETGPFKSVEEASIAHLTPHVHRPEVFAFYGLFATAGAAIGSLISGVTVDYCHLQLEWDLNQCYRAVFMVYTIIALLKFGVMLFLSVNCEVQFNSNDSINSASAPTTETSSLLDDSDIQEDLTQEVHNENTFGLLGLSGLSSTARFYLPKFLVIFMLDSMGYGFMPSAWVVYYFKMAFAISATGLGTLFFFTNAIDSASSLPSAYLAKTLGPTRAMVFTQAPSAVFFILISISSNYIVASTLLILHCATSTMDVVPRQVLLTSVMPSTDLTKVMGIVNVAKTFARCIGPVFTGKLAEHNHLYVGFLINGICILTADLLLGINFFHLDKDILRKQSVLI